MSAGLTIEQVLARSLRMPRRRLAAQSAIARTMDKAEAAAKERVAGVGAAAVSTASNTEDDNTINPAQVKLQEHAQEERLEQHLSSSSPRFDATSSSSSAATSTFVGSASTTSVVAMPSASVSKQAQRYSIPIPKEDPDPYPDRPTLRHFSQQGLVRNSDDLLTNLLACKQVGDWGGALTAFTSHTKSMSVTHAHIRYFVDNLVDADKDSVLCEMAANGKFANDYQADHVLRYTASALNRRGKWKEALSILSKMRTTYAPIESYNEIIASREETGEWREAMSIVFDLKDKHDLYTSEMQKYERKKAFDLLLNDTHSTNDNNSDESEGGGSGASLSSSGATSTVSISPSSSSRFRGGAGATAESEEDPNAPKQLFPKPDAMTWTSLITILEKCGQDRMANEVLKVVPPAERESILASYAALIHMWSHQKRQRW